jgi:hypothetical protein
MLKKCLYQTEASGSIDDLMLEVIIVAPRKVPGRRARLRKAITLTGTEPLAVARAILSELTLILSTDPDGRGFHFLRNHVLAPCEALIELCFWKTENCHHLSSMILSQPWNHTGRGQ